MKGGDVVRFRARGVSAWLLSAIAVAAFICRLASPALAAPVPDAEALERLRVEAMKVNRFRIVTVRGVYPTTSLRAGAEGVAIADPVSRAALIVGDDTGSAKPPRAAWAEIERIEGARSARLKGAMIGAAVGGLVGLGAMGAFGNSLHDASGAAILFIPIGALIGAPIGAIAYGSGAWRPLYP